ncbi:MAG: scyllo-inosose 3-dehydrogenase [Candidatus Bathyarchaeia archaeon]
MLAAVLYADFDPRRGYAISRDEVASRKVREGSSVWRNPRLRLEERDIPKPRGREVLIRVKAVGICGSDIHMVESDSEGYMLYPGLTRLPVVLGHEFSGIVEEVGGGVRSVKPGDMVTSEEMLWCGECLICRSIDVNHCTRLNDPGDLEFGELGFTHDGAMAEYVVVHEKYLWSINSLLDRYRSEDRVFEAGSLVEPASVAYRAIFNRAGGFDPGSYVAVWGAGPIGLSAIALAKTAGASRVIAFEVSSIRIELARSMGADYVFNPIELERMGVQPWEKIIEVTDGWGVDLHVEASGVPELLTQMERSLAIGGKIAWIGRAPRSVSMYPEIFQVRRGQIYGSQGHSGWGIFRNVIRLMSSGSIDTTKMITSRFRLSEIFKAFERARQRVDGKITLKP